MKETHTNSYPANRKMAKNQLQKPISLTLALYIHDHAPDLLTKKTGNKPVERGSFKLKIQIVSCGSKNSKKH